MYVSALSRALYRAALDLLEGTGNGDCALAADVRMLLECVPVAGAAPAPAPVPSGPAPPPPAVGTPSGSPFVRPPDAWCCVCAAGDRLGNFFVVSLPHRPAAPPVHVCAACVFAELATVRTHTALSDRVLRLYKPVQ